MFCKNLFWLLCVLGLVNNGLWAQSTPSFIPTKIKYEFVPKAETTREGGWQQEWSWTGFYKVYWLSYRFRTGIEVQLYMNNEAGGWTLAGSDIHWFPSEDCDDIDYDVENCTPTIRDNLSINWGSFDGEEYAELTYDGYHSSEHILWDAVTNFYNKVKKSILLELVNPMIVGHISTYTDNYIEVNTKCTACAGKSVETTCGITPADLGLTLQGEYAGQESTTDYFFTCDVINKMGLSNIGGTLSKIIDKSYNEEPEIPLDIEGDNDCLDFIEPPPVNLAGTRIDKRFNLVGGGSKPAALRTGLEYYTLEGNYEVGVPYPSSMSPYLSKLPPVNHKVVREVGKLLQNNKSFTAFGISDTVFKQQVSAHYDSKADYLAYSFGLDALGYELDAFDGWYDPDVQAIMDYEGPQIDALIALEKQNQIEGTLWEIGNEPNMHIRLNPKDYAELYVAYHKRLYQNGLPENSRVALGALILPELLQESRSRFVSVSEAEGKAKFNEEMKDAVVVGHAVSTGAGWAVFLTTGPNGASYTAGVLTTAGLDALGHGLLEYGRYTATRMSRDIGNQLADAVLNVSTADYLDAVLREIKTIAPEVIPQLDVVSLHAYRYEEKAPFIGSCQLKDELAKVFTEVQTVFQSYTGKPAKIWVTEFGNISDPDASTGQEMSELSQQRMNQMTAFFSGRGDVERWFWFQSIGGDKALEQLGLTPNSRLFLNSPSVDANPYFAPAFTYFDETTLSNLGVNYLNKALTPGAEKINTPLGEDPYSSPLSQSDEGDGGIAAGSLENVAHWAVVSASGTVSRVDWPYSEGTGAFRLDNFNGSLRMETTAGVPIYKVGGRIALDVWLPKIPVQDYGNGQINLFVSSFEGTLNNAYVGTAMLDKLAQDNFSTVYFTLSSDLVQRLSDLQGNGQPVQLALEVSSPFQGIILDNLRFQDSDPEPFDDRTPTADILGFENVANWSSAENLDFKSSLAATQGARSLQVNPAGSGVGWATLWSDAFAADESGISIANYVNVDVLPYGTGEFQVSLHCPEHYIHNDWIGRQPLNTLPQGGWSRVSLEIPAHIRANLNTFAPYCRVRYSFVNLTGNLLLDNMSFSVNSEQRLALATNVGAGTNTQNAVSVAKSHEMVLPAGRHLLKMSSTANWAYSSFYYSVSPTDGQAMDLLVDGRAVQGWYFQNQIACAACRDVYFTVDVPRERKLLFQWWEQ